MNLKLIMAFVSEDKTDIVMDAAREAGATGATVITSVRGEGLKPEKTFFGLDLAVQRDVVLFLVAGQRSQIILEAIAKAGRFDEEPGSGIALQISTEDAVGLQTQTNVILHEVSSLIVEPRDDADEFGLLGVTDIAREVIGKGRAPDRVNVYEVVTKPVLTLPREMNIKYAVRLLVNFKLSRALVVDANRKSCGIVTIRDMVLGL
jgi:CBS domain-containing protein